MDEVSDKEDSEVGKEEIEEEKPKESKAKQRKKKIEEEEDKEEEPEKKLDEEEDENAQTDKKKMKKKKKVKKTEKKEKEDVEMQEEGEQEEVKKPKKKKKEKKEKPKKFKKGKLNPDIQPLPSDNEWENKDNQILSSCCVGCTNRNAIRAALTNNNKLLKACVNSTKLSSLFDTWSPEIIKSSIYYAMVNNNLKMTLELLKASKSYFPRASYPTYLISYLDTGMVSHQAFGVHVRKVQMARGNRQGNNAFMEKLYYHSLRVEDICQEALKSSKLKTGILDKLMVVDPNIEVQVNSNIIHAILAGNRKIAAHVINRIKNLNNYGFNNLHYEVLALDNEDLEDFHHASIHKKAIGNDQVAPTHCACINPNEKYLQAFLNIDPNVQLMDAQNRKPVHYAAVCEGPKPLELLIKYGANVSDLDKDKKTPLHYAALAGRAQNIAIILNAAPHLIKAKDKMGMQPFHYACQNGHLDAVKIFVEKGIKVGVGAGISRMPPLSFAASQNHYDVCEFLINNKASVLGKDKYKRSPLIYAVRNGNAKIANLLLMHGALWNEPDSSGNTPLHYAAAYGWMQCIDILIQAGADANAQSSWKISPLAIAMLKNHYGMVKHLLNIPGIDVNCKDENGRTLISLSIELEGDEALEYIEYLLKEKGADPNIPDLKGLTPLHYLCTK